MIILSYPKGKPRGSTHGHICPSNSPSSSAYGIICASSLASRSPPRGASSYNWSWEEESKKRKKEKSYLRTSSLSVLHLKALHFPFKLIFEENERERKKRVRRYLQFLPFGQTGRQKYIYSSFKTRKLCRMAQTTRVTCQLIFSGPRPRLALWRNPTVDSLSSLPFSSVFSSIGFSKYCFLNGNHSMGEREMKRRLSNIAFCLYH